MDVFSDTTGEKYLYRYRPDTVYVIDEILNQYIKFSAKDSLNDVFEFSIGTLSNFELLSVEEQNKYLYEFLKVNNKLNILDETLGLGLANKLILNPKVDHLKGQAVSILSIIEDGLNNVAKGLEEEFQKITVACFCRKPLNATMMGHYCNNSKGLMVSYHREGMERAFSGKNDLYDVIYDDNPLRITPSDFIDMIRGNSPVDYRTHFLGRKHSDWVYEDEVRVVKENDEESKNIHKVGLDTIAGVCFAFNATSAFKRIISSICLSQSIPVFECYKKGGTYGFEVRPLDGKEYNI